MGQEHGEAVVSSLTIEELMRRKRAASADDVFPPTPEEIAARTAEWPEHICPACGYARDTPNHEYGCRESR